MYAIVETGGKQYYIQKNSKIYVEKLAAKPGDQLVLDKVLLIGGEGRKIGAPYVAGAKVTVEVLAQTRAPKVLVYKRRRRKDSKTMHGHRQDLSVLLVKDIALDA